MILNFFCENEKSLRPVFNTIKLYEEASGVKLNKTKTTAMLIGSLKKKHTHISRN